MKWLQFGGWPSTHDLDLILETDSYTPYEALVAADHPHDGRSRVVAVDELGLPRRLITQAIDCARGLPLDLFLSPRPGDFSVAAWVEPPYDRAEIGWRPTLDRDFFTSRHDLEERAA